MIIVLAKAAQLGLFGGPTNQVHVKAHQRRTQQGKVVQVREHDERRRAAQRRQTTDRSTRQGDLLSYQSAQVQQQQPAFTFDVEEAANYGVGYAQRAVQKLRDQPRAVLLDIVRQMHDVAAQQLQEREKQSGWSDEKQAARRRADAIRAAALLLEQNLRSYADDSSEDRELAHLRMTTASGRAVPVFDFSRGSWTRGNTNKRVLVSEPTTDWSRAEHLDAVQQLRRAASMITDVSRKKDSAALTDTAYAHEAAAYRKAFIDDGTLRIHVDVDQERHRDTIQKIRDDIAQLDPRLIPLAAARGYRVTIAAKLTDALPHLRGERPRGWPPGSTWDELRGAASDDGATLAVEGTRGSSSGTVLMHELGHVFDCMAEPRISHRTWFVQWYKKAARTRGEVLKRSDIDKVLLNGDGHDKYLHQPGDAGREEAFAEIWSVWHHSPEKRSRIEQAWPGLMDKVFAVFDDEANLVAESHDPDRTTVPMTKSASRTIGSATRLPDGRLRLRVRAEGPHGMIGHYDEVVDTRVAAAAGWRFERDPSTLLTGDSCFILPS